MKDDIRDQEDGWKVVECVDSDVAMLAVDISAGERYGSFFEEHDLAAGLSAVLARRFFAGSRGPDKGYIAAPHVEELEPFLRQGVRSPSTSDESWNALGELTAFSDQDVEDAILLKGSDLKRQRIERLLLKMAGVSVDQRTGGLSRDPVAHFRMANVLFGKSQRVRTLTRQLVKQYIPSIADEDVDRWQIPALEWIEAIEEFDRITGERRTRTDDTPKGSVRAFGVKEVRVRVELSGGKGNIEVSKNTARDASVMTLLSALNQRVRDQKVRFVLVSSSGRMPYAATRIEEFHRAAKTDAGYRYFIRRPIGALVEMFADGEPKALLDMLHGSLGSFVSRVVTGSEEEQRRADIRRLLFRTSRLSYYALQTTTEALPDYQDVLMEIRGKWLTVMRETIASTILSVDKARESTDGEGEARPGAARQRILTRLNDLQRKSTAGLLLFLEVGALAGIESNPPHRTPVLCFDAPLQFVNEYAIEIREVSNPGGYLGEHLAKLREQAVSEDESGYRIFLINALALANVGAWNQARDMAEFATLAADRIMKQLRDAGDANQCGERARINGREAHYLFAYLTRFSAESASNIETAEKHLRECMKLMPTGTGRSPASVVPRRWIEDTENYDWDPRFLSEGISWIVTRWSWWRFCDDRTGSEPEAPGFLLDCLLRIDDPMKFKPKPNYYFPKPGSSLHNALCQHVQGHFLASTLMSALLVLADGGDLDRDRRDKVSNMVERLSSHIDNGNKSEFHRFVHVLSQFAFQGRTLDEQVVSSYVARKDLVPKYEERRTRFLLRWVGGLVANGGLP